MLKKLQLLLMFVLLMAPSVFAQKMIGTETDAQKEKRMEWWKDDRFGMFIHWGLYSQAARHEWVKHNEKIDNAGYQKYFDQFNPDLFDPQKWAKQAKAAGMKYAVLTTKHHEGFCLFDSKFTDYKAPNTKAKRDLVREYVNAFRAQGLKVGFYYSLLDWHHPQYTIDEIHPQSPADKSDASYAKLNKGRDMAKYRQYMRDQITELLTKYGKIDILWLDFSFPRKDGHGKGKDEWGSVELLKLIRKLQPGIIVDNRLNLEEYKDGADFETPEQVSTAELAKYRGKTWETCQTFSGSWGYYRDENTWKTHRQLLDLLITSVSNGGNLILNVGPTARGEFDYRATRALDSLAYWMHANSKSVYNCTFAPDTYKIPEGTKLTYNKAAGKLYIHLFNYPQGKLVLPGYKGKIKYAQFLNDSSELLYKDGSGDDLELTLPAQKPPYEIPVIELTLQQ
ncbi:alpha-L-fucosidase [Mucilaginibacter rubeus]|uniref:alpha-L-fucosidase n=1 Tax=Mucilaginibacter rubeus TaxID=2027860 RepID=A0AAE6MGI8_9SPHI|nr:MULTISPECIES: alpha-L-fucosidase [Mucilaginibacter]QEM02182.1 alpha-L-fucosidase [Mucilaginibacter rubeus]QEM14810.1 alpha-L-fucosidase [Mucilaginibacter gossypii]QTE42482.1 alpha-L-fucosidase [Mucilaginibacter rubeus]QTE49085.1 alpha-L-fucosidase [Mucilaginibacter rubeus]QTE54183.1 alpha-L-fucosidase [Mucilaginibacter rubeus]